MDKLFEIISNMTPEEALSQITTVVGSLLADLDAEARERFLMNLINQSEGDKVSSMVHLWLAECMGEGVDPTQMCQSLVDKVAQSKQLLAIADPDLIVLFEDWLEELEAEVRMLFETQGPLDDKSLAEKLGLSRRGAKFMLTKLQKEGPHQEWILNIGRPRRQEGNRCSQ